MHAKEMEKWLLGQGVMPVIGEMKKEPSLPA